MAPTQRTRYTERDSFTLIRGATDMVTFSFPPPPSASASASASGPYGPFRHRYATRLTLPPRSTWTPAPHWHERYSEYIACLAGRLLLRLDGVERVVTPADGPQLVAKGVVHEFMRADTHGYRAEGGGSGEEEDVVVEEWTEPEDGAKHVFFRNLIGVLEDGEYWGWKLGLQALLVCDAYDNYNVVVAGSAKGVVTHALYAVVRAVGWACGLKEWYEEYTPRNLREVAAKKAQ